MKNNRLWYRTPAPNRGIIRGTEGKCDKDPDWEAWSLPLGCGYMGANVFGETDGERIQITENSLSNPKEPGYYNAGLNNFAELHIMTGHAVENCRDYERDLSLDEAVSHVQYTYEDIEYRREYLTSYPDKVLAVHFAASKPGRVNFRLRAEIPNLRPSGEHYYGKEGTVRTEGTELVMEGRMEAYELLFEGRFTIRHIGGELKAGPDYLEVCGADSAWILGAVGTNYRLEESVFLEPVNQKKLAGFPHPHERIVKILENAKKLEWEELKRRHVEDYRTYFGRVELDLGGEPELNGLPTDERLKRYQSGEKDNGLEALYFQYGRYLLIASSRKGTLPANLQGIWNAYEAAPWTAGYWHNINVQMNYWPAFSTNLAEMFEPYVDYNLAFRKLAGQAADECIEKMRQDTETETYVEPVGEKGQNGWAVSTGAWAYTIGKYYPVSHSGPGTGGLTAKLFWDYFDYTQDHQILEDVVYPALESMSQFLGKTVVKDGEEYLVYPSASPEQCIDGVYPNYYHTKGCMFDQQMVYECYRDTKKAAQILGRESDVTRMIDRQIDHLSPVLIGESGQIKEYREEKKYGEIGDPHHRHISQLVGLMPGQTIHKGTPEWLEAAKRTLIERGDRSTGWAMAHRLNAWARTGDGEHTHKLLRDLLTDGTLPNLWDIHPPFQIDGNFGGTSGIAEMLLQSNGGFIEPLPALPEEWKDGSFRGLAARGSFVVDAVWREGRVTELKITSRAGGRMELRYPGIGCAACECRGAGKEEQREKDRVIWNTEKGTVLEWQASSDIKAGRTHFMNRQIKERGITVYTRNSESIFQDLGEGVTRKILSYSENMMIVEMHFEKGAVGALHQHEHEQVGYIADGSLELTDEGEKAVLTKGDSYYMAPGERHGVKALEETRLIDVFTPMRKDFLK